MAVTTLTGVHAASASAGAIPAVPAASGHWAFDEGSGTTAADSSGSGHTAALGSGASWTAGQVGSHAISVGGTAAGVATVSGPVVDTSQSFTVSTWLKLNSLSGYQTAVSIAGGSVAGFYLGLRADNGKLSFTRLTGDTTSAGPSIVVASTPPSTGVWYHLVGVDDVTAGRLYLYLDGRLQGSAPYTSQWKANGDTLIGHGFYGGNQVDYVNGAIDDVSFYQSALSAAQVAALDTPAAYSFDDGAGTTAADVSGHGNTLTLGSGAAWAAGHVGSNSLLLDGTATGNATTAAGTAPVVDTSQPFSVSAWVNLNSLSGFQTFASIDGANVSGFYLQLRGDTGRFAFTRLASDSTSAAASHADASSTPSLGTWYYLTGVNDVADGRLLLYVDGVLQSSAAYTGGWRAGGATVIGGGLYGGARVDATHGYVDDVTFDDYPVNASDAALAATQGTASINVIAGATGATVPSSLFGTFMEDINHAGEGGIYDDEARNSGFNDSTGALNGWSAVAGGGVTDTLTSDTTTGPTSALTESGRLAVTSGVSSTARAGIANAGYYGVAVAPKTTYQAVFFAKATAGFTGPVTVDIESTTGTVFASATVKTLTTAWKKYVVSLTTPASTPTTAANTLDISTTSASANGATIWFGATYLYPPAYQNKTNHLRIDLMEKLAALHPAFYRVPGGNYLEGNTYANRFNWSTTLGQVYNRPGHDDDAWGYWSTDGMGLDEYLQMAEEIGAQPVLAVYAGYTLGGASDTGTTLTNDVTDAVNELHYALDPTTTAWGAERAANGHPAPYDIHDVEIGNEDFFSSTYSTRYPLFYNAIHAAFPSLTIIATGSGTGGSPYDILDEHFYETPAWMEAHSDYFDTAARGSSKVFVGEFASMEGFPTSDLDAALGDASWMLGMERNSDLVTMASYAPLFANVNGYQWAPDMIGFDNTSSYGSPTYYVQKILANHHGSTVVSDTTFAAQNLQVLVTKTGSTYYLTVVNTGGAAQPAKVSLADVSSVGATGSAITMSGSYALESNFINAPTDIAPVQSTVYGLKSTFSYTFPSYSLTVLKFTAN